MRNIFVGLIIFLSTANSSMVSASSDITEYNAPLTNPSQVISAINNYRQQNGLTKLSINNTLMSLAQGQSDYQASTGTITHTGPGGTSPKDRAYAAGYGNGNTIFMSEIIYGGYNATVNDAIKWWMGSSIHNQVMLDSRYVEIGVGVTTSGDWTYYTAEIAWVSGYPASTQNGTNGDQGDGDEQQNDSNPVVVPITKSTPRADGTVIHIVQPGQYLSTIADVYSVTLQSLLTENNLNMDSLIFPGDEILIPTSSNLTKTPDPPLLTPTNPSPSQSSPIIGNPISTAITQITVYQTPTIGPSIEQVQETESSNPSVKWVIILAFVCIFAVVVGSIFLQKQPERPSKDDPVR